MVYKSNLLTLVTMVDSWYIDEDWFMGPRGRFYSYLYHVIDVGTGDVFCKTREIPISGIKAKP